MSAGDPFATPDNREVAQFARVLAEHAAHIPHVGHASRPEPSTRGWSFVITRDDGTMFAVDVTWRAPRVTCSACGDDLHQGRGGLIYDSASDPLCYSASNGPHQPRKASA